MYVYVYESRLCFGNYPKVGLYVVQSHPMTAQTPSCDGPFAPCFVVGPSKVVVSGLVPM